MQFFVCVAGLPLDVANELKARSPAIFTEDKSNAPIVRPIKPPYAYRDGMSEGFLLDLSSRFRGLAKLADATVLLAYVAYEPAATSLFVRHFFPFALAAPLTPFYPDQFPKHERRHELGRYIEKIILTIEGLRKRARVVRDVLSGQNFNPLLLPLRNFHSRELRPRILSLFEALGTSLDPRSELENAKQAILAHHPLVRLGGKADYTPFFQDDRKLRFKSPGQNRHGMARLVSEAHNHHCLINSRVRLGGPFDALFHYDCEYERGKVNRSYPNCHGAEVEPANSAYVNIAPNDAIR